MRKLTLVSIFLVFGGAFSHGQTDSTKINNSDSTDNTNTIPVITVSLAELEDDTESQDVSGLLQSSKDVFTSIAGFNFSAARFRVRGYDSENFTVMMNGITLNNPENGRAIWAYWGGLNDITRYQNSKH